jgi:mRNA interferase MazF
MVIRQGDVYWVELEAPSGSEPGYRHPHVVVQNNVFNQSRINTVVVCALSSNLKRAEAPGNVLLEAGEAGLSKPSVVLVSQIFTVDKSRLDEYIGSLSRRRVRKILEGIQLVLEPRELENQTGVG